MFASSILIFLYLFNFVLFRFMFCEVKVVFCQISCVLKTDVIVMTLIVLICDD